MDFNSSVELKQRLLRKTVGDAHKWPNKITNRDGSMDSILFISILTVSKKMRFKFLVLSGVNN
ncbi:hypothetical protein [Pseudoalteromonas sp. NBT06-2]|uniref:hypothetical protein n=1 Tax=Pseudoalteromonas sp. NBT06-2 TaxID=2025950 RepID=UPI001140F5AD|nr:hypothetical protein [Pseudoalteromonas sp. NBT06-2]